MDILQAPNAQTRRTNVKRTHTKTSITMKNFYSCCFPFRTDNDDTTPSTETT
ncbi:hypothetical protein P692DRAFT_20831202 [Suillus brevipes Sb2]|nr:hypothetical protein P692DRAFT_20831202 [Suillus brevipes Sb2]